MSERYFQTAKDQWLKNKDCKYNPWKRYRKREKKKRQNRILPEDEQLLPLASLTPLHPILQWVRKIRKQKETK